VRPTALLALVACLPAAACGGEAGDLMAIEVTGGFAQDRGRLDIVLASDGRGSCNGSPKKTVPSDVLIDARELERDLGDLAEEGATYGTRTPAKGHYVVRTKAGTVRWTEGEPALPAELPQTQLLALRLDRLLCRPGSAARGQTPFKLDPLYAARGQTPFKLDPL
jgi:hypothetical protein